MSAPTGIIVKVPLHCFLPVLGVLCHMDTLVSQMLPSLHAAPVGAVDDAARKGTVISRELETISSDVMFEFYNFVPSALAGLEILCTQSLYSKE